MQSLIKHSKLPNQTNHKTQPLTKPNHSPNPTIWQTKPTNNLDTQPQHLAAVAELKSLSWRWTRRKLNVPTPDHEPSDLHRLYCVCQDLLFEVNLCIAVYSGFHQMFGWINAVLSSYNLKGPFPFWIPKTEKIQKETKKFQKTSKNTKIQQKKIQKSKILKKSKKSQKSQKDPKNPKKI